MPTLADLQKDVLQLLKVDESVLRPFGNDLEQWMSYLSVDQPWLSYADNLRNRAAFSDASHAVATSIAAAEGRALKDPMPLWLERLIGTWFDSEATLISFNYDTLVERAAEEQRRLSDWGDIYRIPFNRRPIVNHGLVAGSGRYSATAPDLFKLHGSTNWAFSGLDSPPTDPVNIVKSHGQWQEERSSVHVQRGEAAARYADLEPLIIPPTGTKGTFYSNRALQAQWRDAFQLLRSAVHLTIIGYSFPVSDLGARHFITNSLPPDIPITVVDYSEDTLERIASFISPSHPVKRYVGSEAVATYVAEHCGDFVAWGTRRKEGLLVPYLRINHQPSEEAERHWNDRNFSTHEDISDALTEMVEKLYPGLTDRGVQSWVGDDLIDMKVAVT